MIHVLAAYACSVLDSIESNSVRAGISLECYKYCLCL